MTAQIWYVATLARYVLVEAETQDEARNKGQAQFPTPVRTVRHATPDEIDFLAWHHEKISELGNQ